MTVDEFQEKYHDYAVYNEMDAISDSLKINNILVGAKCLPVKIGNQYCLMLDTAASLLMECGII